MTPDSASAAITTIAEIYRSASTYKDIMGKSKSLIDIGKPLRVEPLTMIDSALVHNTEFVPDVMQTVQSLFTGFWMQAVDMVADKVAAKALTILEQVNPQRDASYQDFVKKLSQRAIGREALYFSREAYKHGLPTNHSWQVRMAATENDKGKPLNIADASNLAVGKMVQVSFGSGTEQRSVNVAIRLASVEVDQTTLMDIAVDPSQAAGMYSRINSYRDNDIGLFDLLFCTDLIRARKKQLLKDKNGVYEEVRKRQLGHKRAGIMSGTASVAEASNLVVVSNEFTEQLQARHGLDIDDFGDRSKIMDSMQCMIFTVVDRLNMRVKFYYSGLRNASSMGVNDIRIANRKSNGPDIMDIFAALKEGAPPRF